MKDKTDRRTGELPGVTFETLVTQAEVRRMVQAGLVSDYLLERRGGESGGWVVEFWGAGAGSRISLKAVKSAEVRVFRSLDSAVSAVEAVGLDASRLWLFPEGG